MTDFDLDRLGDVWRQRPDPAEMEELKRSAERVSRRARWGQRLDAIAAIVVGGVVLFMGLSNPRTDTLIVGAGAIVVLLVSQIRSRRLRREELRALTGSAEAMIAQSIARLEATSKRTRLQILLIGPGIAFGLVMAGLVDDRSSGEFFDRLVPAPPVQITIALIGFVFLAAGGVWLARAFRRTGQELSRLIALREDYRKERESAGADEGQPGPPDEAV